MKDCVVKIGIKRSTGMVPGQSTSEKMSSPGGSTEAHSPPPPAHPSLPVGGISWLRLERQMSASARRHDAMHALVRIGHFFAFAMTFGPDSC